MGATFGEITGLAEPHLDAAIAVPTAALDRDAAVAAWREVYRVAVTLSRYVRDVAPYDEVEAVTSQDLPGWMRSAADAREALQLAAASLRIAPGAPDAELASPMSAHLAAAAAALSAGRDLLQTHFASDAVGAQVDRSPWAPVVCSEAVSRAVLEVVARWSGKLILLADGLSAAPALTSDSPIPKHRSLASACHWLLIAGSALQDARRSTPAGGADTNLLTSIPVNSIPARLPPGPPETIAALTEGIEVSAARLRFIAYRTAGQADWSPAATADSWKWTATAAAVIADLSQHILRSVTEPASQLHPPSRSLLHAAASATSEACTQWREVAVAWENLCTETRGLTAPGITDTSDLVLRVGRLVFTDPLWSPSSPRRAAPLRDPADLAPGVPGAAALVGALLQAADALTQVASAALQDAGAAHRAQRLYVPTRTLPARYDIPQPYWHAPRHVGEAVLGAYQKAVQASTQQVAALGAVAASFGVPRRMLVSQVAVAVSARNASAGRQAADPSGRSGPDRTSPVGRTPGILSQPSDGPAERALRKLGSADPVLLLRAKAIDKAGRQLLAEARNESTAAETGGQASGTSPSAKTAESFPRAPRPQRQRAPAARRTGRPSPMQKPAAAPGTRARRS